MNIDEIIEAIKMGEETKRRSVGEGCNNESYILPHSYNAIANRIKQLFSTPSPKPTGGENTVDDLNKELGNELNTIDQRLYRQKLIESINCNAANLDYIANGNRGKINGTLAVDIDRILIAYASTVSPAQDTVTRDQVETFLAKFNLSEVDQRTIADWFCNVNNTPTKQA